MKRWSVYFRPLSLWLVLMMHAPSVLAEEHWQQPSYIAQSFTEIVLRNEYALADLPVRKWMKPIHVWVLHKVGNRDLHQSLLEMHLAHLAKLTQRSMTLVEREADADIKVVFSQQDDFAQDIRQYLGADASRHIYATVCMANIEVNAKFEITKAAVVIPVDQASMHRKLVSCIVEELTQVMGLPNDSEKVYPSIFNDQSTDDLLTGLDGLLIRLLYHPSLKPGMSATKALPIIHKILRDWQADGTIMRAEADVKQGDLYKTLGF